MDDIIKKLLAPGLGILASDESTPTITKKLATMGITSTPEVDRKYRQIFLGAKGLENYISGVILFDETVHQKNDDGFSFVDSLADRGVIPGVKADEGLEDFGESTEKVTLGLDGLSGRLKEYYDMGIRFAKWRAIFDITDMHPSNALIEESLNRMVEFCQTSIKANIVPIPEPEVLMGGNHTTTRCEEVTRDLLKVFFKKLKEKNVDITKIVLKTNMVLPGEASGVKAAPLEVANATLRTLRNSVPAEVPGIVFLSGGQTSDEAIANLNEIEKLKADAPWQLTFSYLRALEEDSRIAWEGKDENVEKARSIFLERLQQAQKARNGEL